MCYPDIAMKRKALYGNVAIKQDFCQQCEVEAFVIAGRLVCCNRPHSVGECVPLKRVSNPCHIRNIPGVRDRRKILKEQQGKCLYCSREFGSLAYTKSKPKKIIVLKIQWDHVIPFSYNQNNSTTNFVAACHQCNRMKHNKLFHSVEEIRKYVNKRIEQDGLSVHEVQKTIPKKNVSA